MTVVRAVGLIPVCGDSTSREIADTGIGLSRRVLRNSRLYRMDINGM